ncbi:MAG TPA: NUDIX hydrolase [Anaerolineae bacterium]|nr:NUDIX hydrolase [Anaerolineae bacterium]
MKEEITLSSRRVYEGRIVHLRVDTVRLEDGHVTQREIVEHPGAVAIVALDDGGNVLLVRQFRQAAGEVLWEIPAGTRETGEDAETCARRELREETGHRASHMERLLRFYTSPGFCTEQIDLYLATGLSPASRDPEADEAIEVEAVPLTEALEMIRRGEIRDAKTIVGLLALEAGLGRSASPRGKEVEKSLPY